MDSALRPRDIQARIRSGESAEAVAAGGADHRRQDHGVRRSRARRAPARRRARPALHRAPLGRRVRRRRPHPRRRRRAPPALPQRRPRRRRVGLLAPRGRPLDPHRRLRAAHAAPAPPTSPSTPPATTSSSTTTTPAGWSARAWPPRRPARDDLQSVRERRLTSVGQDELPLGDDAIELVTGSEPATDREVADERRRGVPRRHPGLRRPRAARGGRRGGGRRARAEEPPLAVRCKEEGPGLGAELGRDHVRRSERPVTQRGTSASRRSRRSSKPPTEERSRKGASRSPQAQLDSTCRHGVS